MMKFWIDTALSRCCWAIGGYLNSTLVFEELFTMRWLRCYWLVAACWWVVIESDRSRYRM